MEVVGAVSAIITVIQITATVVSICYDYQTGTRHFPKEIVTITHELQSLRNCLERLADIAGSQADSNAVALPTLKSLNVTGGPLDTCKVELKQLESKLKPAEGRHNHVSRALVWPLREKDVQKTLGTLARQRGLLQLALAVDQTTMTLAISAVTSRNEKNLIELNRSFHAVTLKRENKQILRWLAAPDPSPTHDKVYRMKQRGTGRWLMQNLSYINWKDQPASFLWLYGIPGCGKTVLCSTVIEDVASTCRVGGRSALAYYYFVFHETKKQTCEDLVRSLVTQLFCQSSEDPQAMEALFTACEEGQRAPTIKNLVQALRELSQNFERVHLVLDALDECVEIPAVMSILQEICGWHNPNLHILVTSRKEVKIEKGLWLLITDSVHIQNTSVDADINLLVRECLRSDPGLSRWPETIKAEVEKTLCEGSKGMFRWAVCQLDTLRRCIKKSALRKALASIPRTLDDTYERILCGIDQDHAEDALKVLQWLAFSARPLELQEVAEATAFTFGKAPRFDPEDRLLYPTDLLAICCSLISVTPKPTSLSHGSSLRGCYCLQSHPELTSRHGQTCSTDSRPQTEPSDKRNHAPSTLMTKEHPRHYEVCLAHDSVKEYLVSERIKRSKASFYSINEASANAFLASSCLAYIMHFKEPLSDCTDEYLSEYPLLRYSAEEWEHHVTLSGDLSGNTAVSSVLKDFFLTQDLSFANWLVLPFSSYHSDFQQMEEKVDGSVELNWEGRLYHASRLGLFDICKILLEQGVNADPPTKSDTGLAESLSTPLQIAAHKGNAAIVQLLLDHGANVNQRSVHGSTLDYAVAEGQEATVRLLLERGANITIQAASPYYGLRGLTSLELAARTGQVCIVRLMLDHGRYAKPRESYNEAYHQAIAQGHHDVANLLLVYGVDPNYCTGNISSDGSDDEYFDVEV